jgi:hypothetical protein
MKKYLYHCSVLIGVLVFYGCSKPVTEVNGNGIIKDPSSTRSISTSTIFGTVYYSGIPCRPLNMKIPPCDGPYPNYEVIIYDQSGMEIVDRIFTDDDGNYSFTLPAGIYTIYSRSVDINMKPVNIPNKIPLNSNKRFKFDIVIDTGIK